MTTRTLNSWGMTLGHGIKKKKKNAAGRTNACLLERDFHKHRSAHQHKEVEEWPSWHDFDEYSCHFSRSSTVRKANSWPGKSPPPTDYQRLHAKCFRHISARTSRVTCDLEIIRKMFFFSKWLFNSSFFVSMFFIKTVLFPSIKSLLSAPPPPPPLCRA